MPIKVSGTSMSGKVMTITFDQPVTLSGTPQFVPEGVIANVVSARQTAVNQVAITYDGSVVGATAVDVGYRDPAIRNASGGYVTATIVPLG